VPIAPWLLPVLWQEHDWRAALQRLASQPTNPGAAVDLARATEYIDPDRRRAIAVYEQAQAEGLPRARELATEIGWWSARARLTLAARTAQPDPGLALDEAVAWWDAGHPDLCALALAGARGDKHAEQAAELGALVASRDVIDLGTEAVARAVMAEDATEAADAYVMAARFAQAAVRSEDVTRWLEAALVADPGHAVAASLLLGIARTTRDPERLQRWLNLRLDGADGAGWIDGMRTCAFALIDSQHHRGFGLRLLRQTLERAYEAQLTEIPGHLAMWIALAAHGAADRTRRDLLPFVLTALQSSHATIDRVWLAALAAEISLRDANNPVVAGAYAEIVAEHAPEHPLVRELVVTVASDPPMHAPASPIPAAAIAAAAKLEGDFIPERLDHAYAEAARVAQQVPPPKPPPRPPPAPRPPPRPRTIGPPSPLTAPAKPRGAATSKAEPTLAAVPSPIPPAKSGPTLTAVPSPIPPAKSRPTLTAVPAPIPAAKSGPTLFAVPSPIAPAKSGPVLVIPARTKPASVAPASLAKSLPLAKPSSIIPPTIVNPAGMIPAIAKPAAVTIAIPRFANLPPVARAAPVLTALRIPDRPELPPRPAEPPNATVRARRISIPIDLCLIKRDGTRITGHSRDLSTSGLFVLTEASLAVGDDLDVELMLPGGEAFTEDEFTVKARVARTCEDGYGIELVDPDASLLAALEAL
jgi:hypothetical protein